MSKAESDPIRDIINNSGNSFQCEVVNFLRKDKWSVLVSPFYNDNVSEKPREIDVIAEKSFDLIDFGNFIGTLTVKFIIECKYINKDVVFWFDDKNMIEAEQRVIRDTNLKPTDENIHTKEHHYLTNSLVAKLFSSNQDKFIENEIIYKAINQCLNAMISYRNQHSIIPNQRKNLLTVTYPIILCNSFDKFYQIKMGEDVYSKINNNFQLEVNYAYLNQTKFNINEYFLIDVIESTKFEKYLKELEDSDIKIIKQNLFWKNYNKVKQ